MDLEIFSDEIYFDDPKTNKRYIGLGSLFVPLSKKLILNKKLSYLRCLYEGSDKWSWYFDKCPIKCREDWHKLNNCEIHHSGLINSTSNSHKKICKNWLNFLIDNNKNNKELIYFKILYIDMDKLDDTVFGSNDTNIYSRFYETTIKGGLKYFFKDSFVNVKNIYHDIADDKESHDYFPWHLSYQLNKDESSLKINEKYVKFIDSNHKTYLNDKTYVVESQFIQFIDLILGSVTQNIFHLSDDKTKKEIDSIICPLVYRLINEPYNPNSSYHYFKKQDVSIFPKNYIMYQKDLFDNLIDLKGEFHRDVPFKKCIKINPNESLDNWF